MRVFIDGDYHAHARSHCCDHGISMQHLCSTPTHTTTKRTHTLAHCCLSFLSAASVTLVQAGVADNVLPPTAQLSINFRLLPWTPVSDTLRHVQRWLGPTANASVVLFPTAFAPSSVTDDKGPAFQQVIRAAIQEGWTYSAAAGPKHAGNGVPVLPYLMPAGSDSKHYQNLTDTILRFSPYLLTPQSVNWIHGTDERLSVQDFQRALCTFRAGLRLAGQAFV